MMYNIYNIVHVYILIILYIIYYILCMYVYSIYINVYSNFPYISFLTFSLIKISGGLTSPGCQTPTLPFSHSCSSPGQEKINDEVCG